jgi:ribonuclease BN (tRNA processing enzyme)
VEVELLGSGGGAPSAARETACVFLREGENALLIDAGTGVRRLVDDSGRLRGARQIDVVLTHFHLDHVAGLSYLPLLGIAARIWGPGAWLYGRPTGAILSPLMRPPLLATDVSESYTVNELQAGDQEIAGLRVRASAQPHHWDPTAGIRIEDVLALITDTPYEPTSALLAAGVEHLLHEAWSASGAPLYAERDATARDAGRVAHEAGVAALTLIHLDPRLADASALLADARRAFLNTTLGEDEFVFSVGHG